MFPDTSGVGFSQDGYRDPDALYALIATSGTNGLPKLVSLTQNNEAYRRIVGVPYDEQGAHTARQGLALVPTIGTSDPDGS